ncbi:MAG: NUDIX domain-containing protein [Planctomycetes bacterium]|nr:NUDIX domain-containing protein [Planctomycetota bacterium]
MTAEEPLSTTAFLGVFGVLERRGELLLVANERRIDGRDTQTWDLPGGGVELGETLIEALVREMKEEVSLDVAVGELLFVSEGERRSKGRRLGVWRSFFFVCEAPESGVARAGAEVLDARWFPLQEAHARFTAPYHHGFRRFLESGRRLRHAFDVWEQGS